MTAYREHLVTKVEDCSKCRKLSEKKIEALKDFATTSVLIFAGLGIFGSCAFGVARGGEDKDELNQLMNQRIERCEERQGSYELKDSYFKCWVR